MAQIQYKGPQMSILPDEEMLRKINSIEARLNQLDEDNSSIQTKQIDTLIKNAQWCLQVLKDENIQIRDLKTLARRFTSSVRTLRDDIGNFVGLAGLRANSTGNEQYTIACEHMKGGDLIAAMSSINGRCTPSVNDPDLIAAMDSIMRSLRRVEIMLPSFMLSELKEISQRTGLVQLEQDSENDIVAKFNIAKKIGSNELNMLEKEIALILNENAISLLQEEVERITETIADGKKFANQSVETVAYFGKTVGENRPEQTQHISPKR